MLSVLLASYMQKETRARIAIGGSDMRIGPALLVIWLIIGAIAAGQRGYYNGTIGSCTKASTVLVTVLAGPLNYVGANPKVDCTVPQPSK